MSVKRNNDRSHGNRLDLLGLEVLWIGLICPGRAEAVPLYDENVWNKNAVYGWKISTRLCHPQAHVRISWNARARLEV